MSSTSMIKVPWIRLSATTASPSDDGFTPVSEWMSCAGLESGRCEFELRARMGNLEIIPAVQYTNNPYPASPTLTVANMGSTWTSANGVVTSDTYDISANADTYQFVRFGFVTRNTSGTTLSTGEVRIQITLVGSGDETPYRSISIPPQTVYADSTTQKFLPSTDWMSAANVGRARGRVEARNFTGNLQVTLAIQTATDPDSPDSPTAIGSAVTAATTTYPSSYTTVSTGSKRFFRLGWAVQLTSGTTTAVGMVAANVNILPP